MSSSVAFLCKKDQWKNPSQVLAKQLNLHLIFKEDKKYTAFLYLDELGFLDVYLPSWGGSKSLGLDFSDNKKEQFKKKAWSLKSLLPRALGLDKKIVSVLDITAGFCEDSFILTSLGIKVSAVEQSKTIVSLVTAALQKTTRSSEFVLIGKNSLNYMQNLIDTNQRPPVIYMDPMFEISSRKALSNKSMQVLQVLEPYTEGLKEKNVLLLNQALACASERVVLKRHKKTPSLKKPNYILEGKLVRYDVYLV
ncbi:MAG: class I SAM-dependent methyltransferase [Bdellovibrionaceae bacterium]|nr:class I SAM-dependent methyltransferase [Pseudobdellovibrionaceae bacterium]